MSEGQLFPPSLETISTESIQEQNTTGGNGNSPTNNEPNQQVDSKLEDFHRFDALKTKLDDLKSCLDLPISIIQNLLTASNCDSSIFELSRFLQHHGEEDVEVLLQDPDSFGYDVSPNARVSLPLKHYINYMNNLEKNLTSEAKQRIEEAVTQRFLGRAEKIGKYFPSDLSRPSALMSKNEKEFDGLNAKPLSDQPCVQFCVNVDVGGWKEVTTELNKLPPWLNFSVDEIFSHLPINIPGLSEPQLYFKVPGVWTGGHEENSRFHSINCNHGPGTSVWGAIAPEYVTKFREVVLRDHNIDIYKNEGRWFADPEYCKKNGIPMMMGLQRPGETVVLNGGTLHWVQSSGFSINSSWNFGVATAKQMELAFEREAINLSLHIRNLVPLSTLGIRTLIAFRDKVLNNGFQPSSTQIAYIKAFLTYLLKQNVYEEESADLLESEIKRRSKKKHDSFVLEEEDSCILVCDYHKCARELVHYYVACQTCAAEQDPEIPMFFCAKCGVNHAKKNKNHKIEARTKEIEKEQEFSIWINTYEKFFQDHFEAAAKPITDSADMSTAETIIMNKEETNSSQMDVESNDLLVEDFPSVDNKVFVPPGSSETTKNELALPATQIIAPIHVISPSQEITVHPVLAFDPVSEIELVTPVQIPTSVPENNSLTPVPTITEINPIQTPASAQGSPNAQEVPATQTSAASPVITAQTSAVPPVAQIPALVQPSTISVGVADTLSSIPPSCWIKTLRTDQVLVILDYLKLQQHKKSFETCPVDGRMLYLFGGQSLLELGIKSELERVKLLAFVEREREQDITCFGGWEKFFAVATEPPKRVVVETNTVQQMPPKAPTRKRSKPAAKKNMEKAEATAIISTAKVDFTAPAKVESAVPAKKTSRKKTKVTEPIPVSAATSAASAAAAVPKGLYVPLSFDDSTNLAPNDDNWVADLMNDSRLGDPRLGDRSYVNNNQFPNLESDHRHSHMFNPLAPGSYFPQNNAFPPQNHRMFYDQVYRLPNNSHPNNNNSSNGDHAILMQSINRAPH